MQIGLYEKKHWLRKKLTPFLSLFEKINPSIVTATLFPVGFGTGVTYYFAAKTTSPSLYLFGALLLLFRMVLSTLDGLIAETFGKCSRKGELLNRLAPEWGDLLFMGGLVAATRNDWGILALLISWFTTFTGLLPSISGRKPLSIGPVGQTDRVVALLLFSLTQLFYPLPLTLFFFWCLFGGILTVGLRLKEVFR